MAKGKYHKWLTDEGLLKIEGWARDGLTDEQIADKMNITTSTLYDWLKKYSEISESLKRGKDVVDRLVENALLKKALGYETQEEVLEVDEKGRKRKKVIKKHIAPDTTAQIFWLKNRKPNEWRDKQKIEADIEIEDLSRLGELLK